MFIIWQNLKEFRKGFAIKISKCALFVGYESMATIRLVPVLEFGVGSDEKSGRNACFRRG